MIIFIVAFTLITTYNTLHDVSPSKKTTKEIVAERRRELAPGDNK